ncbi:MAG: ornithine carbamoyltransferase [Gammaproteobacteria bacterium]
MAVRHFLSLLDLSAAELRGIISRATEFKRAPRDAYGDLLQNRTLAMIFEKSSTRTRVSFEAGMTQLGGHALFLPSRDLQLGRGETIQDSARVMSRMLDCIMIRAFSHETVEHFAATSQVPVINGLTDLYHPCQLLADLHTFFEQRGDIRGRTVAWVGDGNNMCNSYINAARLLEFSLRIACPDGFEPHAGLLKSASECVQVMRDPRAAANGADLVATDVWASMGHEDEHVRRKKALAPYQVTADIIECARDDALFMHCLPAHRDEEVTAEVLDGPHSVVWEEAENRLHAQKALLEFLLLG